MFKKLIALVFILVLVFSMNVSAAQTNIITEEIVEDIGTGPQLMVENPDISVVDIPLEDGVTVSVPLTTSSGVTGEAQFYVTQQTNENSYEITYRVTCSEPFSIVSCDSVKILEYTWLWPDTYAERVIWENTGGTTLFYGSCGFFQESSDLQMVRLDTDNFRVYTYLSGWISYGQHSGAIYVD